jgi:hypothetical protein
MNRRILNAGGAIIVLAAVLLLATSCFNSSGTTTPTVNSSDAVRPKPSVVNVVASTSGLDNAYFATLDITVKNDGAEGTILVVGSVTQNSATNQAEEPVFLKQGETHELKLTFPLVWKGGAFTSNVQTIIP